MKIQSFEFTQLATRIATALNFEKLMKQLGTTSETAALNAAPTDAEVIAVKHVLRLAEEAGYEIHKRG